MFEKYSIGFYTLGWAITLYPVVLSYIYFRRNWTKTSDIRLEFSH